MAREMKLTYLDDAGDETTVEVPAKWEICSRCRGEGHHNHPDIGGNGITSSEWAEWDIEDRETYMSGGYDVRCEAECENGKVLVPDEDAMDDEDRVHMTAWRASEEAREECEAEERAERRYWSRMAGDY